MFSSAGVASYATADEPARAVRQPFERFDVGASSY
jgi:hypothetical protein